MLGTNVFTTDVLTAVCGLDRLGVNELGYEAGVVTSSPGTAAYLACAPERAVLSVLAELMISLDGLFLDQSEHVQ